MKPILVLSIFLIFISSNGLSQNNEGKKVEFKFSKRLAFHAVDDRYDLLYDTIYHSNNGFRVYSGYDTTIDSAGNKYVVFSYPKWNDGVQIKSAKSNELDQLKFQLMVMDSLSKSKNISMDKAIVYQEIIDSLTVLYEIEKLRKPVHTGVNNKNGLKLAMREEVFEKLKLEDHVHDVYSLKWKYSLKFASGFMTVPFKLRPKIDSVNFNMTTDVTLGAYFGIKKRISRSQKHYIIIPVTLGLSYINVGNNETSNVNTEGNSSVVPGWTWSTGLVFEMNGFNMGFVTGMDYASGVGDDWIYNGKIWYSFSIGYSFFSKED